MPRSRRCVTPSTWARLSCSSRAIRSRSVSAAPCRWAARSRACSTAVTAASTRVSRSARSASEKGRRLRRPTQISPIVRSPATSGRVISPPQRVGCSCGQPCSPSRRLLALDAAHASLSVRPHPCGCLPVPASAPASEFRRSAVRSAPSSVRAVSEMRDSVSSRGSWRLTCSRRAFTASTVVLSWASSWLRRTMAASALPSSTNMTSPKASARMARAVHIAAKPASRPSRSCTCGRTVISARISTAGATSNTQRSQRMPASGVVVSRESTPETRPVWPRTGVNPFLAPQRSRAVIGFPVEAV